LLSGPFCSLRIAKAYRWIIATTGSITLSCAIGAVVGSMTDSAFLGYLIGVCLSIATLGLAQGRVLGHLTVVAWFAVTLIGIVSGAGVGFLASIPAEMVISQQVSGGWETLGTIVIGMALAGSSGCKHLRSNYWQGANCATEMG